MKLSEYLCHVSFPSHCFLAPSNRSVRATVQEQNNRGYKVEYLPTEVGIHKVEVYFNKLAIGGSPFDAKVYDSANVKFVHPPTGIIGQPVECTSKYAFSEKIGGWMQLSPL